MATISLQFPKNSHIKYITMACLRADGLSELENEPVRLMDMGKRAEMIQGTSREGLEDV